MAGFGFLGPANSSDGIVTIQQLHMKGMSQRQETTTKAVVCVFLIKTCEKTIKQTLRRRKLSIKVLGV